MWRGLLTLVHDAGKSVLSVVEGMPAGLKAGTASLQSIIKHRVSSIRRSYLPFSFFVFKPRSNIGADIAIEEYVPTIKPKIIA